MNLPRHWSYVAGCAAITAANMGLGFHLQQWYRDVIELPPEVVGHLWAMYSMASGLFEVYQGARETYSSTIRQTMIWVALFNLVWILPSALVGQSLAVQRWAAVGLLLVFAWYHSRIVVRFQASFGLWFSSSKHRQHATRLKQRTNLLVMLFIMVVPPLLNSAPSYRVALPLFLSVFIFCSILLKTFHGPLVEKSPTTREPLFRPATMLRRFSSVLSSRTASLLLCGDACTALGNSFLSAGFPVFVLKVVQSGSPLGAFLSSLHLLYFLIGKDTPASPYQ